MKGYYKIRELAESAPFTTISTEGRLFSQQDMIKFAELIVKECAIFSMVNTDDHYDVDALYKHFGVE